MKSLLLKIIFAGLTIGLVPQAAAMKSTHSMQLRSRARSNSVSRASHQPACMSVEEIMLMNNPGLSDYYLSLREKELSKNSAKDCACRSIILLLTALVVAIVSLNYSPIYEQIATPSLNKSYASTLGIQGNIQCNYVRGIGDYPCFFNSEKYGKVVPIAEELQTISHENFTIVQLRSKPQGYTPTCLKHAFSNLATMDLLHRDGKTINSEYIAPNIQQLLHAISFPEPIESIKWTQVKNPVPLSSTDWVNKLLNHAKSFFPNKNMKLLHLHAEQEKAIRQAIALAIEKLKTHDSFHILLDCEHATALSIIKGKDNKYLITYMDSNNPPLSSGYDAYYEIQSRAANINYGANCYEYFKTIITKLREKLTQNEQRL
jgi:hypothetical protein